MTNDFGQAIENFREQKMHDRNINLYILMHQTQNIISNAVDIELQHLRVTQPQVMVLTMLSRENHPVTLDELASWCIKEFSSMFTLINRMEKKGLVKKRKKSNDSKTYISITKKGSLLYHQKVTERSIHLIFDNLNDVQKQELEDVLKILRDNTRDLLGLDFRPSFLTMKRAGLIDGQGC
jgi:DNA-binding MarR family transcriptional regulator